MTEDLVAVAVALGDTVPAPAGSTVHLARLVDIDSGDDDWSVTVANTHAAAVQHGALAAVRVLCQRARTRTEQTALIREASGLQTWPAIAAWAREASLIVDVVPLTVHGVAPTAVPVYGHVEPGAPAPARTSVHVAAWHSAYDGHLVHVIGAYGDEHDCRDAVRDTVILALLAAGKRPWASVSTGDPVLPVAAEDLAREFAAARAHVDAVGLDTFAGNCDRYGAPTLPADTYLSLEHHTVHGLLTAPEDPVAFGWLQQRVSRRA